VTTSAVARHAIERICGRIVDDGIAVQPGFLDAAAISRLAARARSRDERGEFHDGAVGHGSAQMHDAHVRGDRILWLDDTAPDPDEVHLFAAFESLRGALNASTMLGLFAFECHYAVYPPGATYRRHFDRFRDDDTRVLSCVLYLNANWTDDDGGVLRIHLDRGDRDVRPTGGTLVCFLSDRFEHEVLPSRRERVAVSGWFKRRPMPRDA
jgi:SM-20-related protein